MKQNPLHTTLLTTLLTTVRTTVRTILLTTLLTALPPAGAQQKLPAITLNAGVHLIQAEVAIRDEERAQGLMFREKMGQNEGMVFRFNSPNQVCMWMKNTLIPLSVAFIDEAGSITNIEEMEAQTLDAHCASKPARYALEMNQGWFKKKNIKAGSKISGLPK